MPARRQPSMSAKPFNRYEFEDGTIWTEFYRSGDDYLLRFPELADFEVSADGTKVVTYPAIETDEATIDGTTQTVNVGDTNAAILGTGATVGADGVSLSQVDGPGRI